MTTGAIDALHAEREAMLKIGTGLTDAEWAAASGCPGWSVKDVLAHLEQLPIMLFTLIGGVVADRHDRRLTLMSSQWVQLSTAAILAVLVYLRLIEIWHILLLSFITGTAQAFGGPAYQSLIPSLVGKQDLTNAIALNSIQFNVARMVGPLLTGAMLVAFKRGGVEDMTAYAACFALNALSFLVVIVSLMSLHIKHMPAARTHNMMGELRQGLSVRARRAQHHGAHGARRRDNVFRDSDADAAAGVRERCLWVGRRRLQRATRVFGSGRGRRDRWSSHGSAGSRAWG